MRQSLVQDVMTETDLIAKQQIGPGVEPRTRPRFSREARKARARQGVLDAPAPRI